MPESRYEVLALFAGAMVAASLFVVSTGTLTPFLESAFRLSQTQLGLVLSVQMIGSLLATAVAGALTDRFGDKAVLLWSGWFMGTALVLAGAVHNFHWVLFWLLAYGIGYAAVTPAGCHAIVFFFKREERGFAMGVRQCGVPIAGVVGSLLLPAVALHFNYQWAFATAGIVTLVACSIASILYREPKELEGERVSLSRVLVEMAHISRDVRLIFMTLTSMALICVQMVLLAFLTLTLVHLAGYAVSFAAGIFTLSQVAAIAGRLSWGWMSDTIFRGSRAAPLAVVCGITAAVALGISLISTHTPLWSVCALAIALGFSAEGWFGVAVIAFAEIGGEEHAGSALGAALTWAFFAAFVSPTVFGAIAEVRGYAFAWRSLALLALVGVIPAVLASTATRRFATRSPMPTA
jgi:MFS family permease